ncbi:MAG: glycosyltransferase family 4 protein [Flavobacterium sp.]|nr:glycosyltransferase family 4 protein [Flavobacterium sp.]
MKIAVISTIRDIWGGSEELWASMAYHFLEDKNNQLLYLAYENNQQHPKLTNLQKKGLIVKKRPGYIKQNSNELQKTLQIGINFLRKKLKNPLREVILFKPDIVIYNGTCYSIALEKELLRYMRCTKDVNFYIIGHLNSDTIREINDHEASLIKEAYSLCKKVFFVSNRNILSAERHLCVKITNAVLIKNPVNITDISYVKYPKNDMMLFAMVGNLNTKHKGQDIVLSILSQPHWKCLSWQLNIFGTGSDEKYIRELINFYDLSDKVFLHGSVTDILELWSNNQVLLMPSHMEGMALAIVEAMICGRVVVTSNVGGASEWIEDNISGFLADSASKNAFEKALTTAYSVREQWELISKKAHESAMNMYDVTPGKTLLNHLN